MTDLKSTVMYCRLCGSPVNEIREWERVWFDRKTGTKPSYQTVRCKRYRFWASAFGMEHDEYELNDDGTYGAIL